MGTEDVGDVYCEQMTEDHTKPYRFVTKSLTMQRIEIQVTNRNVYVGRLGKQLFRILKDTCKIMHNVDLADLYFTNEVADAVVTILGTTKNEARREEEIALLRAIKDSLIK